MSDFFSAFFNNVLSSPEIWGLLATAVVISMAFIFKDKTEKQKIVEGMIVNAFLTAEKLIPDSSAGVFGKVDVALKKFKEEYNSTFGQEPTSRLLHLAKSAWSQIALELKKPDVKKN